MLLRTFGWSWGVTAATLAGALILGGPQAFAIVAILAVLEISLSFDNAVVNATILERMNEFWQKIFLTIGIVIAVFGMRLLFPLLIVGITAKLSPYAAVDLALNDGKQYGELLRAAHPTIAAFGGTFLLMLFLDFIFEDRETKWLTWLEKPLARVGKLDQLSVVVSLVTLVIAAETLAEKPAPVMVAGALGAVTYLAVNGLGELFESQGSHDTGPNSLVKASGKAAFFLFLYLEVLDASFSFDGVIGAFAISNNILIISAGLGVGAMYIRSLTVYLVRQGTLNDYAFLEHGAHWAIGALAAIMLVSIGHEVPELVTGLLGVGFIGAAFLSSLGLNKRRATEEAAEASTELQTTRS